MARSQKQIDATQRNHRIWRLRGLWANLGMLDPDLAEDARRAVDRQLERLGAKKHSIKHAENREAFLRQWEDRE